MKSKIAFALLVCVCLMLFAGCDNESKTLYQSDSVTITREGNITLVSAADGDAALYGVLGHNVGNASACA